jgi:hypothetical protein
LVGSQVQVLDLDASTNLEGRASVAASATVVLGELDVLEMMCPDAQGTSTGALAKEVMASVVNDKAEVQVASKVDGELDLSNTGSLDRVQREATNGALGAGSGILGLAGGTLEEWRHDRSGIIDA